MEEISKILWTFVLLLFALTATACGTTPPTSAPLVPLYVTIGQKDLLEAPLYIAAAEGYFREGKLAVTFTRKAAPLVVTAPTGLSAQRPGFLSLARSSGALLLIRPHVGTPFAWASLAQKTILVGDKNSFEGILLAYILKQHRLSTRIGAGLPLSLADAVLLDEPAASSHRTLIPAASLAAEGGPLLGQGVAATPLYLQTHRATAQSFTKAIFQAELWIYDRQPVEITKALAPYFPGVAPAALARAVGRYWQEGVWAAEPLPTDLELTRTGKVLGRSLAGAFDPAFAEKALRTVLGP